MQTLNIIEDNFDQDNTFAIELQSRRGTKRVKCSVRKDYQVKGDGILWALQHGATLKSHYSAKDVAELDRLRNDEPVRHGDTVSIEGKQYTVRVLGDFSNAAIFDPVEPKGCWIKGTEDDDEAYEYIPSAAELS